jgi:hypothetical protein
MEIRREISCDVSDRNTQNNGNKYTEFFNCFCKIFRFLYCFLLFPLPCLNLLLLSLSLLIFSSSVLTVVRASGVSIPVRGVQNSSFAELYCFINGQIVSIVTRVERKKDREKA